MLEVILHSWIGSFIRLVGIGVLYTLGVIKALFSNSGTSYSFKKIYNRDFNKGDEYNMMLEDTGQLIVGTGFIALILFVALS